MKRNRAHSIALAAVVLLVVWSGVSAALAYNKPSVASGGFDTVGLKADGTPVATGRNGDGQCNVSGWTNVTAVAAGAKHTVGLKSDGTVVATGLNSDGQCNVSGWTNIVAVSVGSSHTVGVKSDHTVIAAGDNTYGQCYVSTWTNITAVAAGNFHTVGVKSDGTVVAAGNSGNGQLNVSGWTNVTAAAAGYFHTVGLHADGTVVATGYDGYGECDVSGWSNVVALSAGYFHTVGLKRDGTVVATGRNVEGQCNVSGWKNIIAIAANGYCTLGLRGDGTVVTTGSNYFGELNVSAWHLAGFDDNIPGAPMPSWLATGTGSSATDKYDVYAIPLTAGVPARFDCVRTSGDANFNIHLYPPTSRDIWRWGDWVAWSWSDTGAGTETINYTPTQTGTFYIMVDTSAGSGAYRLTGPRLRTRVPLAMGRPAGFALGLKPDGSVIATGYNYYGQCDLSGWSDIVSVAAGGFQSFGLKSDGSVVATGDDYYHQRDVSGWTDIVAVATAGYHTVGLKSDGTVVWTGSNFSGEGNLSGWSDIVGIAAGDNHSVGVRSDGSVVATGDNYDGECNVASWTNVRQVAACTGWYLTSSNHSFTVGLKADGSVVATGSNAEGQCNVSGWRDIVAVAAGGYHTVGLKADGSVVATGYNNWYHPCDVSAWKDIVAIAAGEFCTVGLKSDGTMVWTGDNNYGQCNMSDWRLAVPSNRLPIPGTPMPVWTASGDGSLASSARAVYSAHLTAGVPARFECVRTSGNADFDIHLYPPGSTSTSQLAQRVAWSSSDSGAGTETIDYTPSQTGTFYLVVETVSGAGAYRLTGPGVPSSVTAAGSGTRFVYGQSLVVNGTVSSTVPGAVVAGARLLVEENSGGGWSTLGEALAASNGTFSCSVVPPSNGTWRVSLVPNESLAPCTSAGANVEVIPVLSTPRVSGTIRAKKTLTFSGSLAPAHAGPVKVEFYRATRKRVKRRWVTVLKRYKTYTVNTNSAGAWRLKVKLSKADWRVRAGHVDAGHLQGWSGYRRVRITR